MARQALDLMQVDALGLDDVDRRVLRLIIEKHGGGPVGLNTIAASVSEEQDTIMDVVEPYLLQLGFLDRSPQGRNQRGPPMIISGCHTVKMVNRVDLASGRRSHGELGQTGALTWHAATRCSGRCSCWETGSQSTQAACLATSG